MPDVKDGRPDGTGRQPLRTAGGFVRGTPQGGRLARRYLVLGAAATVAMFALLAQLGENGILSWWQLRGEAADLDREVEHLEASNLHLENQLDALANDPEALERVAREGEGMRRRGEEVLAIVRDSSAAPPP